MNRLIRPLLVAGCLTVAAVAAAHEAKRSPEGPETLRVEMKDREGRSIGTAELEDTPHGLLLRADLLGVAPGAHGFHLHQVGKCDPPFDSAGPHFAREGEEHGFRDQAAPHAGDLPNLYVPENGALRADFFVFGLNLRSGRASLIDADGASLLIHAEADDYRTDPAGEAGERIACGVIEPAEKVP